ncbi:MAG: hypothetical protein ACD_79C00261G0002 [uncultured bacterium]|nr:MAG: hypothetical protein ACD_79C00261G0002 [uncultured bacterium]
MKINIKNPPRKFKCGMQNQIEVSDCGEVYLENNEQLTFYTKTNKEYDVAIKEWGFYATPSINGRLKDQGFKTALVKNSANRYYVMLVDTDKIPAFNRYLDSENQTLIEWLDERK